MNARIVPPLGRSETMRVTNTHPGTQMNVHLANKRQIFNMKALIKKTQSKLHIRVMSLLKETYVSMRVEAFVFLWPA